MRPYCTHGELHSQNWTLAKPSYLKTDISMDCVVDLPAVLWRDSIYAVVSTLSKYAPLSPVRVHLQQEWSNYLLNTP